MTELQPKLLVGRAIIQENERVLLVQRAFDDLSNPGLWEFPGGKIDSGEPMEYGLVREIKEETGLTVYLSEVAHIQREFIEQGRYAGRQYEALFYSALRLSGELAISSEHNDAHWSSLNEARQYELTPESASALVSLQQRIGHAAIAVQ